MGVESHCIVGTAVEKREHISPFAALPFPNLKTVPSRCWVEAKARTRDLPATFCNIIEPL